jgi:hypothetical protein
MENTFKSNALLTFLLPAAVIIFLLEGCCISPLFADGAKTKSCNCGNQTKLAKKSAKDQPAIVAAKTNTETINMTQAIRVEQKALTIREINDQKTSPAKKLPLGIKGISTNIIAGPNMSFKSSNEDLGGMANKKKPGIGIQCGVSASYSFSDKFAVAPALLFKHNSATETFNYSTGEPGGGGSQEIKSKYNFSYISVPVLAEVKVSDQLTVMAGPELNLLVGATVKSSGYGETDKTDIKDNSVKTGVGIQGGIKYSIPNSPIGIQLLYDQRLSRLNEKNSSDYPGGGYETPAWKMGGIQVGVTCAICELLKKNKHSALG